MSKKSKFRKPQIRKRQKKTVGQAEFVDVVYMDRETIDGKRQVFAACTCGEWRSSPAAITITKVGMEAKAHVLAGKCQLRFHAEPVEIDESELKSLRSEVVDEE